MMMHRSNRSLTLTWSMRRQGWNTWQWTKRYRTKWTSLLREEWFFREASFTKSIARRSISITSLDQQARNTHLEVWTGTSLDRHRWHSNSLYSSNNSSRHTMRKELLSSRCKIIEISTTVVSKAIHQTQARREGLLLPGLHSKCHHFRCTRWLHQCRSRGLNCARNV